MSPPAYGYQPSLALAVTFTVLTGVLAVHHTFVFVGLRTWYLWFMLVAIIVETTSFGLRAYASTHITAHREFVLAYVFQIATPLIIGDVLFTTFSRLKWYTLSPSKRNFATTWIPNNLFLSLFRLAYTASFTLSCFGAAGTIGSYSTLTSTDTSQTRQVVFAESILRAGLIFQLACTSLFTIIALRYMCVSRRFHTSALLTSAIPTKHWRHLLLTTTTSAALLVLRTTFRVLEFSSLTSPTSSSVATYLHTHEFAFWLFDVGPVLTIFVLFALCHPGACLPSEYTRFFFSKKKILKIEKKVAETQTWSSVDDSSGQAGWSGGVGSRDAENQLQHQHQHQQQYQPAVRMMHAFVEPVPPAQVYIPAKQ